MIGLDHFWRSSARNCKTLTQFYERLGDDIVAELVDWFNAVDATYKSELKETNELNWERFKDHMDSRLNGLRADLMKWMFIYWSGTVVALIGMHYFGPK